MSADARGRFPHDQRPADRPRRARCYVIAEMSANHHQSLEEALAIRRRGGGGRGRRRQAPDLHRRHAHDPARTGRVVAHRQGHAWAGRTLYDLYTEATRPGPGTSGCSSARPGLGLEIFSTAVRRHGRGLLEKLDVPAYKVASFELVDDGLLRRIARDGRPVICSTGMASLEEIGEAVGGRAHGRRALARAPEVHQRYPSPPEEMNLRSIPRLSETFDVPGRALGPYARGNGPRRGRRPGLPALSRSTSRAPGASAAPTAHSRWSRPSFGRWSTRSASPRRAGRRSVRRRGTRGGEPRLPTVALRGRRHEGRRPLHGEQRALDPPGLRAGAEAHRRDSGTVRGERHPAGHAARLGARPGERVRGSPVMRRRS